MRRAPLFDDLFHIKYDNDDVEDMLILTPGTSVTSPLHNQREVLFEMCQRCVLLPRLGGEVRQV